MTHSTFFPYDTGPHDTDGHSFAAAWIALTGFAVLSGLIVLRLWQAVALNHFFG